MNKAITSCLSTANLHNALGDSVINDRQAIEGHWTIRVSVVQCTCKHRKSCCSDAIIRYTHILHGHPHLLWWSATSVEDDTIHDIGDRIVCDRHIRHISLTQTNDPKVSSAYTIL